jgi:hypothetical protein
MWTINQAAAGLCAWVIAVEKYHHVWKVVGPKQLALAEAEAVHNKVMEGLLVKQRELKAV